MIKPNAFTPYLWFRRKRGCTDEDQGIWYIISPKPEGGKKQTPLPFSGRGMEAKARKALTLYIERWKASKLIEGDASTGPLTVAGWGKKWIAGCEARGLSTVRDYRDRLTLHILPIIGHLRLDKVTPDHIDEVMAAVKAKGRAPRTQRHVYFAMRAMFNRAVPRLLDHNPCSIPTSDLPKKKDADPEWRATAIFTREEVQALLTSPLIPPDRRVFYAVMFLGAMRFGEISALCVRNYDPTLKPLGRLQVSRSWHTDRRELKSVKTDVPRLVPVHPWLAQILGHWLAHGWVEMMGRQPGPDDILIPTRRGTHRSAHNGWQQLNGRAAVPRRGRRAVPGDLERLGLRPRRQHDARRTFITLAQADGARKDRLRLITHGPEGDIIDIYTEMPWEPLCEEVLKLRLGPPAPAPLAAVSSARLSSAQGCQVGCQELQGLEFTEEKRVTPSGIETGRNHRTIDANGDQSPQLGSPPEAPAGRRPAKAARSGQAEPLATLATLALRQALAALEKGRVDQARELLERAVDDEAAPGAKGRVS